MSEEWEHVEHSEVTVFKGRRSLVRPVQEKVITRGEYRKRKSLIAQRLSQKQRMSFDELISRGIHAGLEDVYNERSAMEKSKKMLQLNRRLSHRPQPHEITQDEELPLDLKKADTQYYKLYHYRDSQEEEEESESEEPKSLISPRHRTVSDPLPPPKMLKNGAFGQGMKLRSIENPLDWKFAQRSSKHDLIIRGIIPEQYAEVIHGNKSLEDAKKEFEAYKRLSTVQVAKRLDIKMRPTRKDLQDRGIVPNWDNPNIVRETKEKNTESLAMKFGQRMDPHEADQRAIINKKELFSNKDYETHRQEKKEATKQLKLRMKDSLNQRPDQDDIVFRGIVAREYLEEDANIAKTKLKAQRNSIRAQMDSAFGARPAKEEMMNRLYSKNEIQTISPSYHGVLPTTPEYHEVDVDDAADGSGDEAYAFPTFLDRLKAEKKETKKVLKNHMKRRSTIEELQKQGILPMHVPFGSNNSHDSRATSDSSSEEEDDEQFVSFLDRMKNERKEHRASIAEAHARRPTVEDLEARGILVSGSHDYINAPQVYMSNEYASALTKSSAAAAAEEEEEESSSEDDDTSDAYPTFLDRMREEKEETIRALESKHRRRPSQQDLEDQGIVEKGYFANMQVALTNKRERRQSFTSELANFFTSRPDIAQMLTKGLVAAEFIGMDSVEMAEKRKGIKAILDRKLNKKRRPTMDDLEMRGIVPSGYFADAQGAVATKHTRRLTAEKDLASFLPQRMNPHALLERGFIPQHHFDAMMAPNTAMNKQQQAFSAGAMGVAGVYAQKLVKETVASTTTTDESKRRNSKRISSGIASIVLDVPQHAERNLFNHDNWTQNLYESLLNSLRFTQIGKRIEDVSDKSSEIGDKYYAFERLHHTKMNGLQRDKARIVEEIEECNASETQSIDILSHLITEHSTLEQKIRPQMRMLLHKMSLVEQRIANEKNASLLDEYKKELNYYDTYCTELKNVFIMTNNIRSKYQNSIRSVMKHREELNVALNEKDGEIAEAKKELNCKLEEFHEWISQIQSGGGDCATEVPHKEVKGAVADDTKYDPLASDPVTDLRAVLGDKTKSIDNNLDLLSFRISTIPATDYALRVIELCQLSYIYSCDHLKSFFEWFIRFAVQTFVEITYAHTCFTTQTTIPKQLKSIQYITQLTTQRSLFDDLTQIVSYLELLPSNNDDAITSNNNVDHEYVIFHVARYLTAHPTQSQTINLVTQEEEGDIPQMAQHKVNQWIAVIVQNQSSSFEFSPDYNKITNKQNRRRNIIGATKLDATARVRPARAAAIVMDHVYGIHVDA
eukprot:519690_1